MFERLLFKNEPDYGRLIDVGALAEALIFYGHIELICNSATLEYLAKKIPAKILLDLVRSERATVYLLKDQLAVTSIDHPSGNKLHGLTKIAAHKPTYEESAERALLRCTSDRRVAKALINDIYPLSHNGFDSDDMMSTLLDTETTTRMAISAIKEMVPLSSISEDARFRLKRQDNGFYVETNLNFEELNDAYHQIVPKEHSAITPAWLVALLQGAHENLYFAANFRSEITNGRIVQAILREKIQFVVEKTRVGATQISTFHEIAMDGHSLRKAVNDGDVSFADVLRLVEKAGRFREWLDNQPAEADLAREFYKAAIAKTWVEKLPGKTFRWAVFSGLGLMADSQMGSGNLATLGAQGLSALDTFVLDKLIGGWKPNQFINQDLLPLIQRSSERS